MGYLYLVCVTFFNNICFGIKESKPITLYLSVLVTDTRPQPAQGCSAF